MKDRTVYEVDTVTEGGSYLLQRLLPHEFYLIKTMLKVGHTVRGVRKVLYTPQKMKLYFSL